MDKKLKGDIAEQFVILFALKRGWGVSRPIGDRLPYDLILDVEGKLLKVQVKSAWLDQKSGNYLVDVRKTLTNRKEVLYKTYSRGDFDFALVYIEDINVFYVFPVDDFIRYGSGISLVLAEKRQRSPKSEQFREAWRLLSSGLSSEKSDEDSVSNSGKPFNDGNPEPSGES